MPTPDRQSIRELLLNTIHAQQPPPNSSGGMQQISILQAVERKLNIRHEDRDLEQAVLTEWNELFRTGILAWGLNLQNPNPPFFHLTDRGRQALANVARDPNNPDGYRRHLESMGKINAVAESYLSEGLACYVNGLYKAAAVMVGAAAESVIFELRDEVVQRLQREQKAVPPGLKDWRVKTVAESLSKIFDGIDKNRDRDLRERYDACWGPFSHQIRVGRNDAGHPTSINPLTPDSVHASLLVFPELVKLATDLKAWLAR